MFAEASATGSTRLEPKRIRCVLDARETVGCPTEQERESQMNLMIIASAIAAGFAVGASAAESLYILGGEGQVMAVDLGTFSVTSSVQTGATHGPAEMVFGSDGDLYITNLFSVVRYDLLSGTTETVLTNSNFPEIGFGVFNAITTDQNGQVVVGVNGFYNSTQFVNRFYTIDPDASVQEPELLFQGQNLPQQVFDLAYTGPNSALAVLWSANRIISVDTTTGEHTILTTAINSPVSLFEIGSQMHVLTQFGGVYTIDPATGQTAFVANITGLSGSLIGSAVIPSPGSLCILTATGLAFTHRRR